MILSYLAGGSLVFIEFDATMKEDPVGATTVSEYHVETGADIADHARTELDRVSFDVIVSNTPVRVPATNRDGVDGGFALEGVTVETITQFPRILPGVGLITDLLPHGSTNVMFEVLKFDGTMDRTRSVYNELRLLQTTSTLVNFSTHLREFVNMTITNLSAPRNAADGTCVTFSFSAKEIRFVDSEVTSISGTDLKAKQKGPKPAADASAGQKRSVLQAVNKSGVGNKIRGAITAGLAAP